MKLTQQQKTEFKQQGYIINMHGSEYIRAHGRIILFKEAYPEWGIRTNIIREEEGKYIIMKAEILDDKGMVKADGIRFQRAGESFREKCQTCAISRALANLGIGIEFGVAGAEEMGDYWDSPEGKKKLAEKYRKNKEAKQKYSLTDNQILKKVKDLVEDGVIKDNNIDINNKLLMECKDKCTENSYKKIIDKLNEEIKNKLEEPEDII